MKAIVSNLLAEPVTAAHGEDAWDDPLPAAGVEETYTSPGRYPDAGMMLRVTTAAAMPLPAERDCMAFDGHRSSCDCTGRVNDIMHPEMRKLHAGAGCPQFPFADDPDGRLHVVYSAPRRLCDLTHGLMEGAVDQYRETIAIEPVACVGEGSPNCRMAVRWDI